VAARQLDEGSVPGRQAWQADSPAAPPARASSSGSPRRTRSPGSCARPSCCARPARRRARARPRVARQQVGVGDAAPTVPRLRIAVWPTWGSAGPAAACAQRPAASVRPLAGGHGADRNAAVPLPDPRQLADAPDVDHRPGKAMRRLSSGIRLWRRRAQRSPGVLRPQRKRLLQGLRRHRRTQAASSTEPSHALEMTSRRPTVHPPVFRVQQVGDPIDRLPGNPDRIAERYGPGFTVEPYTPMQASRTWRACAGPSGRAAPRRVDVDHHAAAVALVDAHREPAHDQHGRPTPPPGAGAAASIRMFGLKRSGPSARPVSRRGSTRSARISATAASRRRRRGPA